MGKKRKTFKVNVDGFGQFEVTLPKEYTKKNVEQTILNAVLQTLNMMTEAKAKEKFHPAMGMKVRGEI